MELAHLDTFRAIHRTGNLSRAAEELHISQPAVSNHLKALEAQIGRALFVRRPRGVTPTPLADALAAEIDLPLDALHAVARRYRAGLDDLDATLVIGGPADALSSVVVPTLLELMTTGTRFVFETGDTRHLLHQLRDGDLDLVIATTPSRRRGVTMEPLFSETLALVAGKPWIDRLHDPTPEVLANAPLVTYAPNLQLVRRYFRLVFESTPTQQPAIVLPDLRGIVTAVANGAGWSVVPTYLARDELERGEIGIVHHPVQPPTNTLHLATPTARRREPALAAVREHLTTAATHW